MVRVVRLERTVSWSQMCVGTFSRHSSVLFGPFLCSGNSSLTLFCPACFKKPFRLLGFVWDWILCIKRCSARFEGAMTGQLPQNRGAETAPHKQRIRPWTYLHSEKRKCVFDSNNSLIKCATEKKTRSFFVLSIDFSIGYRYNDSEGGE